MSQIKGGVALNYLTVFITNILGLIITPLMIKKMGTSEYGLYTLIGAFVGYLTLLDLGLNKSVVRFVALYRAQEDKEKEEKFLGLVFLLYVVIAIVLMGIGIWGYFNLDAIFGASLSASELSKAKIMFAILIFNIGFTLPGGVFEGICFGYERFVFPKAVSVSKYLVRAVAVILLLEFGYKAIGIVILDTALNFLLVSVNLVYVLRKLKVRMKFALKTLDMAFLRQIFSYSIWIFVFGLIYQFRWKSGQVILGIQTDTYVVAIYAIGIMLGSYYGTFSTAITNVFLPRAARMAALKSTGEELTSMMIKIGRLSLLVLMFILSGFLLFGKQFVLLWVGGEIGEEGSYTAWLIALLLMVSFTTPLVQGFGHSILMAKSKLSFKAILYLITLLLSLVLGTYLTGAYGALGMTIGLGVGWIVAQNIMNVYYHKIIKLNMFRFYKELIVGIIPVLIVLVGIGYLINLIPGDGWINFVLKGILFSIVFGLGMFFLGVNQSEKELLTKTVSRIVKRKNE